MKAADEEKSLFQSVGNYKDFQVWLRNNKLSALGADLRRLQTLDCTSFCKHACGFGG
jgi:hypothetical protein